MKLSILNGQLSRFMSPHDDERQANLSSRGSKNTKTDSAFSALLPLAPISPLSPKEGVPTSSFPPPNPRSPPKPLEDVLWCESSTLVLIPMTGPEMLFVSCSLASVPGPRSFYSSAVVGNTLTSGAARKCAARHCPERTAPGILWPPYTSPQNPRRLSTLYAIVVSAQSLSDAQPARGRFVSATPARMEPTQDTDADGANVEHRRGRSQIPTRKEPTQDTNMDGANKEYLHGWSQR